MDTKKRLHVLHIASGDLWAGAEMQLFTLARSQQASGECRVSAIILNEGQLAERLREASINVEIIDESALGTWAIYTSMRSLMEKIRPDIVHTHRMKENILGSLSALFSGRIASLRTIHGSQEHHLPWYRLPHHIKQWLNLTTGRHLQRGCIAVSNALATELQKDFSKHTIRVIENGIDIESVHGQRLNEQYPKTTNIGIVGRLTAVKRVDLFLSAASLTLDNSTDDWCFHVIGDGPLMDEMTSLARELRIERHVCFHGHCTNVYDHLTSLDVLMMPSDHEGLPMTVLEAMCIGTPVIAHAAGGLPDVLDDGNCGVLVKKHEASAYANALELLLSDNNERHRMTSAARSRVEKYYDSSTNAQATIDFYQQVLGIS